MKYYLVAGSAIVGAILVFLLVIKEVVVPLPDALRTVGVKAIDGYGEETEAAMDIWNGFVGCEFLVPGDDVLVKSDDGAPCGQLWQAEIEWGHAAAAYRCLEPDKSEILISYPGTTWMQTWTIGHELGHVLREYGVEHDPVGIMGRTPSPHGGKTPMIRIRDRDSDALNKAFCP